MEWINALIQGVLLGGQYALLACGLSLIFGVMRIVNLAHGVAAVSAAYTALWLIQRDLPLLLAIAITLVVFAVLGYVAQRLLLTPALRQGELAPLIVSFGLAVIVTNLLQEGFSANSQAIPVGSLGVRSITLGSGLAVGVFAVITLVVAVALIAAVQLFLDRTRTGRAMRATSDDPTTARLMGIDQRHLYGLATAIALTTVALAGVFLGMTTQFSPTYGDLVLIFAFEAVIIGGLGSLWGTLAGGIVLGVAQTIGAQIDPAYGLLAGHLVFLLILLVRPSGLLPKVVTA